MTERGDQYRIEIDYGIEQDIGGRVENRTDTEIHEPVAQLLQSLLAGNVVECERNALMVRGKSLYGPWQDVVNRRFAGRDRQTPLLDIAAPRFKILVERRESLHERASQFIQEFTLRRQRDLRPMPLEQRRAEVPLQRLHLQGDRGLRHIQSLSSARHTPRLRNCAKAFELLQAILFVSEDFHLVGVGPTGRPPTHAVPLFIPSMMTIATIKYVNDRAGAIKINVAQKKSS